jgi:quinol monooxygenase YgiN
MTLHVVAHFAAKPDKLNELKSILNGLKEPTHKEKGCIAYELYQNTQDPTDLTFLEEWESQAHLDAHLATSHVQAVLAQLPQLVAAEPKILTYQLA